MIFYSPPCGEKVRDAMLRGELGMITSWRSNDKNWPEEIDTIFDNGAFSGAWKPEKWWNWTIEQNRRGVRFVTAPDVYKDDGTPSHDETLDLWSRWGMRLEIAGYTPAFVCQIGSTPDNIPDAAVYFLGGTTDWKFSNECAILCEEIKRRGAWLHMGRVNTQKRMRWCVDLGVDSVDGTILKFGPDKNLPRLMRSLAKTEEYRKSKLDKQTLF